jgi:hypothetical protein
MATLIQSYRTEDGKTFQNEVDASTHEAYLKNKAAIELFIKESNLSKKSAGTARKLIPAYLAFTK